MRVVGIAASWWSRYSASVAWSAASVSLSGRSARISGCVRAASTAALVPTAMPACGPPSSLSPENVTRSAPVATVSATVGSSGRPHARWVARSTSAPEPRSIIVGDAARATDRDELLGGDLGGEPDDREVRAVDLEQEAGRRPDRRLVVARVGLVRGADLDEHAARQLQDLGEPERPADLDQLAARDHDLLVGRERGEAEHGRGGVVVDDHRVLGAGELAEQRAQVIVARAARAALEVVLEVRVPARDLVDRGARGGRERRAPEVGVQHDAGRVDHAAQRGARELGGEAAHGRGIDRRARRRPREDLGAPLGDRATRRLDHRPAWGIGAAARRRARGPPGVERAPRAPAHASRSRLPDRA